MQSGFQSILLMVSPTLDPEKLLHLLDKDKFKSNINMKIGATTTSNQPSLIEEDMQESENQVSQKVMRMNLTALQGL